MQTAAAALHSPVVFAHNDLLSGALIQLPGNVLLVPLPTAALP